MAYGSHFITQENQTVVALGLDNKFSGASALAKKSAHVALTAPINLMMHGFYLCCGDLANFLCFAGFCSQEVEMAPVDIAALKKWVR